MARFIIRNGNIAIPVRVLPGLRKYSPLKPMQIKNRLTLSMALSALAHLFIFFSIHFFLLFHPGTPKKLNPEPLEIRLAQAFRPKTQQQPEHKLLTVATPAPIKVAPTTLLKSPEIPPPPPAPQATEEVTGITFPGSIASPFQGQGSSGNSLFNARSAQQEAARAYYQQALAAQARQRTEFQSRQLLQQLHQLLAKALDAEPGVSGNCILIENNRLKCDSSALYEALSKEQKNIAGMLNALRSMGRIFSGFSIEIQQNKQTISIN